MHTYTGHTHQPSSAVLSSDRHWAKVRSAIVLTTSLSPPLSLPLSASFLSSAFSRKVLTSNLSLLLLLPLPASPRAIILHFRLHLFCFSFICLSERSYRLVLQSLGFVCVANSISLPVHLHSNYPFSSTGSIFHSPPFFLILLSFLAHHT